MGWFNRTTCESLVRLVSPRGADLVRDIPRAAMEFQEAVGAGIGTCPSPNMFGDELERAQDIKLAAKVVLRLVSLGHGAGSGELLEKYRRVVRECGSPPTERQIRAASAKHAFDPRLFAQVEQEVRLEVAEQLRLFVESQGQAGVFAFDLPSIRTN